MHRRRVFRWLLRFYPPAFQRRHGEELLAFWVRQSGEARYAGRAGRARFWLQVGLDAVFGGVRHRIRSPAGGRGPDADPRGGGEGGSWQDVGYALRSIRGAPGHAAVVILTLGLGIGATTAIFGVVETVVLRPLPYPAASELVTIGRIEDGAFSSVSWPDFRDWREQATGFAGMAAYYEASADFRWDDSAEQLEGAGVTHDLFEVLRVEPLLGRPFTPEEDRLDGPDALILSWGLWQRRFGGDPGVVGTVITAGGRRVEVVGVMPRDFAFPTESTEYWEPAQEEKLLRDAGVPTGSRGLVFLDVVARLDGPIERAQASLTTLATRLWDEADIPLERRLPVGVGSLHERVVGDVRLTLVVLLAAVALVLLVACANVAGLTLSRAAARTRELAIRVALGAGRGRLVRQLLTESLVLAVAAGVLGVGIAWGLTRLVLVLAPADVPRLAGVHTGPATLAFAAAVTIASGLLFGIVPAIRSTGAAVADGLARYGRGSVSDRRALRPQQLLVVFQVSLAVALLAGATLLVRSYARLMSVETGFATDGVVLVPIEPPDHRYVEPEVIDAFYADLLERVRGLPGVIAATATYAPPLAGNDFSTTIEIEGEPEQTDDRNWVGSVVVRDGYFEATGTPLLAGRDFDAGDRLGAPPVAIVNRTMADRFWPGANAIGKRFRLTNGVSGSIGRFDRRFFPRDWFTVVGVAGDVRRESLDQSPVAEYYRPHSQIAWSFEYVVARTALDPAELGRQIRDLVREVDATVPVDEIRTLRTAVRDAAAEWRFRMLLLSAFGATTCVLAMLGVYALMGLAVTRRQREMGVRMALGATRSGLQLQVLRRGLGLVVAGTIVGLSLSLLANNVLRTMLFGIETTDPTTYAAVTGMTAAVALLACWVPARRASRVDPVRSLSRD